MKVYKVEYADFCNHYVTELIYTSLEGARNKAQYEINAMMTKIRDGNEERLSNEDYAYYFVEVEDGEMQSSVEEYPEIFKSIKQVSTYISEIEYAPGYYNNQTWDFTVKYNMFRDGETYSDYNYSITIKEFEVLE